jgi:ABC-type amino acid transport substrate-binding protein
MNNMKLLHTKLPEFIKKMQVAAAEKGKKPKKIKIMGLENLRSAKMQSLRTGRIEHAVGELAALDNVENLELIVIPRVPETMQTVIVKGMNKDGKCDKAVLEIVNILHPTEEAYLLDCDPENIDDRRPIIGNH